MLAIKQRYYDRMKELSAQSEQLKKEKSKQTIELKPLIQDQKLDGKKLLEDIHKIDEENKTLRRENLFFSRYLVRINSNKIIETFDDYENENENEIIRDILNQVKSLNARRRLAMLKNSLNTKKGAIGWTKVSSNWGKLMFTPYILSLTEQERFAIVAYEIQQTRLEWERMSTKALAAIYTFEVSYQSIESDEFAQETLNRELRKRVEKYRANIGEEEFNSPHMQVPGELFVDRITKRIQSRMGAIGLLRVNTTRLHIRIDEINAKIRHLDDLNHRMEEVDIVSQRTRKIANSEIYEKVDKEYRIEKLSQYPLFRRLQDDKESLNEQEIHINDMEKKCESLQYLLERTNNEIYGIQQECDIILKENNCLKIRIEDIMKVPTITEYAHVIKQRKVLEQEIDIWTQRVRIAEALLLQLKKQQQQKPSERLPPLRTINLDKQLSIRTFNT
ncbi:unnamed protein product [Adineta steineri]|uniref:DUF4201 domain-containing protein n=1 Tax=Adineta steineri TaxID=433720 RepID=A0A815ARK4_9BILA|nr:unnamed protein product [Adineta steineri]CAF3853710.1 unnamed protein product [Adineta steineri]